METRCPHCFEDSVFELWRQEYRKMLFQDVQYMIKCRKCEFSTDVPKEHLSNYQHLRDCYAEFKKGVMTLEKFVEVMIEQDLEELNALNAHAEVWSCNCGEENPANFAACWNCGAESTCDVRSSDKGQIDLPNEHPWER